MPKTNRINGTPSTEPVRAGSGQTKAKREQIRRNATRASADVRRGGSKPQTHCRMGHELTPDNVYTNGDGSRQCRICKRAAQSKRVQTTCSKCGRVYEISVRTDFRHRKGLAKPVCSNCHWSGAIFRDRPFTIKQAHLDYWRNGGKDGTLTMDDIRALAAGLELWLDT